MDPGIRRPKEKSYINLTWGLLLIGAGTGLFLAYLLDNTVLNFDRPNKSNDANVAIYFALIAIFGGLGLLISHIIEKKESKEQNKA
jgi:hypothetical protein